MQFKNLLLTGCLSLVSAAALAWDKPAAPERQSLITDGVTEQYFYNVGSGMFFVGGNDFETRASLSETLGAKVKLEQTGTGRFSIWNYVYKFKEFRKMFTDNQSSIWVDNNNGANCNSWNVALLEDDKFLIINDNYFGEYLGTTSNLIAVDDTRLYFTTAETRLYAGGTDYDEWYSVNEEEYNKYIEGMNLYYTAAELKEEIDDAKSYYPSLDLSAEEAVYNNEESTIDQLKAAISSVISKMKAKYGENASLDNPVDFTKFIVNPSFEDANLNGWTVNTSGDTGAKDNSSGTYHCDNADGNYLFNTWDSNRGYPISQTIQNLPKGVYMLKGMVSSTTTNAYIFANGGMNDANGNEVDIHQRVLLETSPMDYKTETWFTAGQLWFVVDGGSVTIGAVGAAADGVSYVEGGYSWYKADNFQLTYYGNQADSYNVLLTDVAAQAQALLNDDGLYNEVKNALQAAINEANQATTSSKTADEKFEILKNLYIALNNAKAGVELSKELSDKIADLNYTYDVYGSSASQEVRALKETLISQADNYKNLTTDQIKQLINDMNNCRVQLVFPANYETATADAPINVTPVIYSPSFVTRYEENSLAGWQGVMPNRIDRASAECYESIYNMYQPLEYLPAGNYKVKVRAFFRYGFADQDAGINKDKESLAKIYAQTSYTADGSNGLTVAPVKHLYEGAQIGPIGSLSDVEINFNGETKYVPNTFDDGSLYIRSLPAYENVIDVIVAEDGKLTIGIKQDESVTGGWMMMSRWELYYCGPNPEAEVANLKINLNDAGYATFSCKRNVNVSGVEAYKAAVEGETITLTKLEGYIPAGNGVLFYSEDPEAEANLSLATSGDAADVTGNDLKATTKADGTLATLEANSWALGTGNQFLSYTGDAFIHNRAYLVHEKPANSVMRIVFAEGVTTAIDNVVSKTSAREGKFLENGNIVIIRNGVKYNVVGQRIK